MSTRNSKNFDYFMAAIITTATGVKIMVSKVAHMRYTSAISDRVLTCDYHVFFIAPALSITGKKRCARCVFASIITLVICVVGSFGVMNFDWFVDVTHLIGMSKYKVDVICPACMPGDNFGIKSTLAQNTL